MQAREPNVAWGTGSQPKLPEYWDMSDDEIQESECRFTINII
jgi:hypothetical protein